MSQVSTDPRFDVASAISPGQRDYQEDSIITDFPLGSDIGFVVLADGMGGHAAGDIASKIIVTEVFSEIKFQSSQIDAFEANCQQALFDAVRSANECIAAHIAETPADRGMGSTLIAPIFIRDKLYWISVGDSPLYLIRNDEMRQLNEDHSMAPQIDLMFRSGMITEEDAKEHPDRNCLTSVLGGDKVAKVDCPDSAFQIEEGDIFVVSSDGLQYLSNEEIEDIVLENKDKTAAEITHQLFRAIIGLDDPYQDNLSFCVVKIERTIAKEVEIDLSVLEPLQLGIVNG